MDIITCHCGCGKSLNRIDSWGKIRRFIQGHHPHSRAKKYINHDNTTLNTTKNRFYAKVLIPDENGCMIWFASLSKKNRGNFIVTFGKNRVSTHASRFSYKLHYGVDPSDLYVCHKCDNPSCVAPDHLFLGTQKQNMQDMKSKGRSADRKGEKASHSKLTEQQVLDIRKKYPLIKSCKKLAKEFNVKWQTIQSVVSRKSWNHI